MLYILSVHTATPNVHLLCLVLLAPASGTQKIFAESRENPVRGVKMFRRTTAASDTRGHQGRPDII
jgi:hypothetical protein